MGTRNMAMGMKDESTEEDILKRNGSYYTNNQITKVNKKGTE